MHLAQRVGNLCLGTLRALQIVDIDRCEDCLLDAFPGAECVGIDCSYLAEEGGLLHCITAEFS